jgi:aldehyde:ferredoxin oxidoreductase
MPALQNQNIEKLPRKRYEMPNGYCGKIVRVDLTRRIVRDQELDQRLVKNFLGGTGVAAKILFEEVPPAISAFDPANRLIFMTGVLTGTPAPAGARYGVVFKSPQTGGYGEATAGGRWGAELKFAGYDGIVVEGCAETPSILVITDEGMEIKDAGDLWGRDTRQTEDRLQEELGKEFKVAAIGPAGENLVRMSSVINDRGRAAARSGPGAVMGSKKLKAIVVRGRQRPNLADPSRVNALRKTLFQKMKEHAGCQLLSSQGTPGLFLLREFMGYGIVKNWQKDLSEFPEKEQIGGERLNKDFLLRKESCFGCSIRCGRVTKGRIDGITVEVKGPEYESMAALGSQCLNGNMETMILANHLCNILGMDTISTGGVIAFAMECYERGLLPGELLEGKKIPWGDREAMIGLIHDIAWKRGKLGELLSHGVKYASERLGKDAIKCAVHVKGVEAAEHDPRSCQGWGLGYAVGNAGARHTEGGVWPESGGPQTALGLDKMDRTTIEDKPRALILVQDMIASAMNSLGLCYFAYGLSNLAGYVPDLFEAVTGWRMEIKDFLQCGERSFNVKRVFNAREGIGKKEDVLPYRFTHEPLKQGSSKGLTARTPEMLDEYYRLRGWDPETGWPTQEKLAELSLSEESKVLYGK